MVVTRKKWKPGSSGISLSTLGVAVAGGGDVVRFFRDERRNK